MKINVFKTQAKIGSIVRYKGKEYKLADLDRNNNTVCLHPHTWIRCTEVELINTETSCSKS